MWSRVWFLNMVEHTDDTYIYIVVLIHSKRWAFHRGPKEFSDNNRVTKMMKQ